MVDSVRHLRGCAIGTVYIRRMSWDRQDGRATPLRLRRQSRAAVTSWLLCAQRLLWAPRRALPMARYRVGWATLLTFTQRGAPFKRSMEM